MYNFTISDNGNILSISKNSENPKRFHAVWLRDNAPDSKTRDPGNGQRLITLWDIPKNIHISQVSISDDRLKLTFHPDNKSIEYDIQWLLDHAYDTTSKNRVEGWTASHIEIWDSKLNNAIPSADFREVEKSPSARQNWLQNIAKYGFGTLKNGPIDDLSLMRVVELFGYVRETNYGRHFEVLTEINPTNLAYTGLGLQAHTDNPYRDPVPTIQVLYCLESSAAGGENMVVDGFKAIERLRNESPAWFEVLAKYCARFEYSSNKEATLRARRPMIELAPDGELIGIRFNNRSTAAITDVPFEDMQTFYDAYRRLGEIIDDPAMEVTFRLSPGECFVIDNTRILHARKAYSGTGTRWLQGCYADKDGLMSKLASLDNQLNEAR